MTDGKIDRGGVEFDCMDNNINWLELLINILLASFGGAVKKLVDQEKEKDTKKKYKIGAYFTSAIISLFVGIVTYFLCKNFDASQYIIMAFTSIAGFIGTPVIYTIFNAVAKKMGTEVKTDVTDSSDKNDRYKKSSEDDKSGENKNGDNGDKNKK